ncbi:hypothetical protein EMIT0P176_530006 [Pseudomonas sp. IT-P176]
MYFSTISFTATFYKHKPPTFQEKVGGCGFWRLEKDHMGTKWECGQVSVRCRTSVVTPTWAFP